MAEVKSILLFCAEKVPLLVQSPFTSIVWDEPAAPEEKVPPDSISTEPIEREPVAVNKALSFTVRFVAFGFPPTLVTVVPSPTVRFPIVPLASVAVPVTETFFPP